MQDKKMKPAFALIGIPVDVLEEAGITEGDLLQFTAEEGKITFEAVRDIGNFLCDGDCENCPISEIDCDGDCENCPCNNDCDESEVE